MTAEADAQSKLVLERLRSLRQHQRRDGRRSPHKPLLMLLALGQLQRTGSSALPWSSAESSLADLIAEFGPPSRTNRAQSAAYPFTRLRTDQVWVLDHDVEMDRVPPLAQLHVTGRLEPALESALLARPTLILAAARDLALSNFPESVAADVLDAVGLIPGDVLAAGSVLTGPDGEQPLQRRRDSRWRAVVLRAWDRQCAFCGYDGQFAGATAGLDAAHVRWFAFGGPDSADNGLALCSLHHKLFDLGVLGLDASFRVLVSGSFSARTPAGRAVYELHGHKLSPRPGTLLPAAPHVSWHASQVFKGEPLAA